MKVPFLAVVVLTTCWIALVVSLPVHAASTELANPLVAETAPLKPAVEARDLTTIVSNIAPISRETQVRRCIAQATFCFPQNVLGTLLYGLLQLTGYVVNTAELNEVKIVVTRAPFGVSLGKYILIHTSLQTENVIRHEYGHTLQGYKHGPFYLLLEGLVSFMQATFSLISPSYADGYYDRWPEDEANELGNVRFNR